MKLYIKFMVGLQSKAKVQKELEKLAISFRFIDQGVVGLFEELPFNQRNQLKINLSLSGLKLHEAKKGRLIEKIKVAIHEMIRFSDGLPVVNHSVYLSERLNYDYTYLANIFSEVNGITIQQYIILSKIEKVKELLINSDINLSEISFKLHYSSVAHLSGQFKKITGFTPSGFKLKEQKKVINSW